MEHDQLIAVTLGERPADLVITGGQYVNVFSGEIYAANIAVSGTKIAAVGDVDYCIGDKTKYVEASGRYLVPGLIETHIHVGATSLVMTEFARLVVPFGTAVIITDFTEAGKMRGLEGIRFFLEESLDTPLKVYLSPFYTTLLGIDGHPSMTYEEMYEILQWEECIELREWNMYVERHKIEKLSQLGDFAREKGLALCGHMEGQHGRTLQASVATGTLSDHEAGSIEDAIERVRLGVAVQMRFSSASDDMQYLIKAITQHNCDPFLFMFSTDEEDLDDIATLGHIDHRVRSVIAMGVAPIDAIRMATLSPASHLGITSDFGSLTPGRTAFVNLVEDLSSFRVSTVIYGSNVVAEDGKYIGILEKPRPPSTFFNTINLKAKITPEDFALKLNSKHAKVIARVIGVAPRHVRTEERLISMPVDRGIVSADPVRDIAKIAIIERHRGAGKVSTALIQGFGLANGAFGSSYHPGPLHIGVVGTSDSDMAVVANRIAELQGGFVAALNGQVIAETPLPILGFLSDQPVETVIEDFSNVKKAIREMMGSQFEGIYTMLAYLCMPGVEPELRMSVNGLVKVEQTQNDLIVRPISLFADEEKITRD
jgi:adenine deaminase